MYTHNFHTHWTWMWKKVVLFIHTRRASIAALHFDWVSSLRDFEKSKNKASDKRLLYILCVCIPPARLPHVQQPLRARYGGKGRVNIWKSKCFFRFMRRCFAFCAHKFSKTCAQILLPTVMGYTTHSYGLYDPQLWVIQPTVVGSKTSAHETENICAHPGKHLLIMRKNQAHKLAHCLA